MSELTGVAVLVVGSVAFALVCWYWRSSPDQVREELYEDLESAGLVVDSDTRAVLIRQRLRRNRWQAAGAALGMGLGGPLVVLLPERLWPEPGLLAIIPMIVGMTLGELLGARGGTPTRLDEPRATTMQPYRLTDYLLRREVAAELVLAATGVALAAGGVFLLVRDGGERSAAWGTLVVGLLVGGVSFGALGWQRRMLRAPRRAASASQVVANDVIVATGFRDLARTVSVISALSLYALMFVHDLPLGYVVAGFAALIVLMQALFAGGFRPDLLPVARGLTRAGTS